MNEKTESLNCTILERDRAVLFDSGLDKASWAEILIAADFLRNRCPTADGVSTPFERFDGRQLDVSNMRAPRSVADVMVPTRSTGKLEQKTLLGGAMG